MGIEVKPPSINESDLEFKVDKDGNIVFGFMAIDGIGRAKGDALVQSERNYKSIYDFLRRSDYSILNKATLSHLLASGALDELIHQDAGDLDRNAILEILEQEKTELGFYITDHPLSGIWPHIEMDITNTIASLEGSVRGERVTVGGIISKMTKRTTKKGFTMYNLSFQDITGTIEVVIFPRDAKRIDLDKVYEGAIGHLDATLAADGDDENPVLKLIFNHFIPMETATIMGGLPIFLKINHNIVPSQVERIEEMIKHNPGDSPVFVDYEYEGWRYTLQFKGKASYDIKDDIENILRLGEMELEWAR
jgi:DNA polymerase-3 subunit alpha